MLNDEHTPIVHFLNIERKLYLFPRRRLTGTRLGGGIAGAIGCDNYQGVVMNLSLRRLTDIACSLAWAEAAWGIAALLVIAWIVGIAASVLNEPLLQVR